MWLALQFLGTGVSPYLPLLTFDFYNLYAATRDTVVVGGKRLASRVGCNNVGFTF